MGSWQLGIDRRLGSLVVVDRVPEESCVMEGAERLFEGEALIIALALPLGLDAVVAGWFPFVALYASPSASLSKTC